MSGRSTSQTGITVVSDTNYAMTLVDVTGQILEKRSDVPVDEGEGARMPKVYLTMAMSLDGFITGPHDDAQNPAGINGMRLMDWLDGVEKGGRTPNCRRAAARDPEGNLPPEHIDLDLIRPLEAPNTLHLRRVERP